MNENYFKQLEEMERFEKLKKEVLRNILTKEAIERLGRVRMVKPQLAMQIELYLIQLYQAGKIKGNINEEQLKTLLKSLSEKKEYRIKK
jgi:programmed cell death protein 5